MDLIGDIAAIHIPLPAPGNVTPRDCFPDALEQAHKDRQEYTESLDALCDELKEDPLLVALGNARARKGAAETEIRQLLAYAREFHGDRPYKLEPLAEASGMSVSGIRTAYKDGEIDTVALRVGRKPDSRRFRPPAAGTTRS
ncbi:hypothetical protein [Streptomyces cinerochromogenes]|uniref:hypothetical protein n=1 Tax=Streptomyces cinerochromogenes TaxID=66422 RepID=UPI0033B8EA94